MNRHEGNLNGYYWVKEVILQRLYSGKGKTKETVKRLVVAGVKEGGGMNKRSTQKF